MQNQYACLVFPDAAHVVELITEASATRAHRLCTYNLPVEDQGWQIFGASVQSAAGNSGGILDPTWTLAFTTSRAVHVWSITLLDATPLWTYENPRAHSDDRHSPLVPNKPLVDAIGGVSWFNEPDTALDDHGSPPYYSTFHKALASSLVPGPDEDRPYFWVDELQHGELPALYCGAIKDYDSARGIVAFGNALGELTVCDYSAAPCEALEMCMRPTTFPPFEIGAGLILNPVSRPLYTLSFYSQACRDLPSITLRTTPRSLYQSRFLPSAPTIPCKMSSTRYLHCLSLRTAWTSLEAVFWTPPGAGITKTITMVQSSRCTASRISDGRTTTTLEGC